MSNSTLVAVRVPSEILENLDKAVKDRLKTDRKANRSQLILDALEAYLSQAPLDAVSLSQTTSNVSQTSYDVVQEQIESAIEPLRLEVEGLRGKLPA